MHFHYMAYMVTPQHKKPLYPGCQQIYNFRRPFLGHHFNILVCLIQARQQRLKKIFTEMMHFYYMTYMAKSLHKNPCPRGHEISNFGRMLLGHHNYKLVCLIHAREQSKRNTSILHFLPQKHLHSRWGIHEIYKFQQMLHTGTKFD